MYFGSDSDIMSLDLNANAAKSVPQIGSETAFDAFQTLLVGMAFQRR